jgi:hypothetical protein
VVGHSGYNFGIPNVITISKCRAHHLVFRVAAMRVSALVLCYVFAASAADWSVPEQQLAQKIVGVTGTSTVSLSFENRSSLGRRDSDIIQNGLRSALESVGVRFTRDAATNINISLSENVESYVWVAHIRPSAGESSVVMVSAPRPFGPTATRDFVPLSLRTTSLWEQDNPILDLAVLEENAAPSRIAVLSSERVSIYRMQGGRWQQEQVLEISHTNSWPRDLRGRLVPAGDHAFDIYLPGVFCQGSRSAPLRLACHDSSDPWPLVGKAMVPAMAMWATFSSARNFFEGTITPAVGNSSKVLPFYSVALIQRDTSVLSIFSGVDRQVHTFDGTGDRTINANWGSDIAAVRTSCGSGWQVLATGQAQGGPDEVRAYEVPNLDPVAVTAALEFPGVITALWTEARGDTAIVIAHHEESSSYEAFRLAVACSQ